MKKQITLLLSILLLFSCKSENKTALKNKTRNQSQITSTFQEQSESKKISLEDENNKKDNLNRKNKERLLNKFECNKVRYQVFTTDSIQIQNTYKYQKIKDSIYKLYPKNDYKTKYKGLEKAIIKKEKIEIYRTKDTIKIRLDTDSLVTIYAFNEKRNYDIGRAIQGYYSKENLVLIKAIIDEGGHYYLLNKRTGEQTLLIGKPVFSPNRKLILAINGDLEAGYTTNGIQLFRILDNLNLELICFYELSLLEPRKVKWIDNNTFILELLKNSWTQNDQSFIYNKIKFDIE